MVGVQRGYGQHGTELVDVDDLEATAGGTEATAGDGDSVSHPLDPHGSVTLGHGAGQRQALDLLQVSRPRERHDFRTNCAMICKS